MTRVNKGWMQETWSMAEVSEQQAHHSDPQPTRSEAKRKKNYIFENQHINDTTPAPLAAGLHTR